MATKEQYAEEAAQLMAAHTSPNEPRSQPMCEGFQSALAWCLAGKPAATSKNNRTTQNPYLVSTPENESWQAGWAQGKQLALNLGIIKPSGVIHQFERQEGSGWIEVLASEGGYSWRVTDCDGEPMLSASTPYQNDLIALRDALVAGVPEASDDLSENGV